MLNNWALLISYHNICVQNLSNIFNILFFIKKFELIVRCKTVLLSVYQMEWRECHIETFNNRKTQRERTFVLNWQSNLWYLQLGIGNSRHVAIHRVFVWAKRIPWKKEIQLYTWRHVIWLPISPAVLRPTLKRTKLRLQIFLHAASVPELF